MLPASVLIRIRQRSGFATPPAIPGGTAAAGGDPVVTPGGVYVSGGAVGGASYASAAGTGDDVTVSLGVADLSLTKQVNPAAVAVGGGVTSR